MCLCALMLTTSCWCKWYNLMKYWRFLGVENKGLINLHSVTALFQYLSKHCTFHSAINKKGSWLINVQAYSYVWMVLNGILSFRLTKQYWDFILCPRIQTFWRQWGSIQGLVILNPVLFHWTTLFHITDTENMCLIWPCLLIFLYFYSIYTHILLPLSFSSELFSSLELASSSLSIWDDDFHALYSNLHNYLKKTQKQNFTWSQVISLYIITLLSNFSFFWT